MADTSIRELANEYSAVVKIRPAHANGWGTRQKDEPGRMDGTRQVVAAPEERSDGVVVGCLRVAQQNLVYGGIALCMRESPHVLLIRAHGEQR